MEQATLGCATADNAQAVAAASATSLTNSIQVATAKAQASAVAANGKLFWQHQTATVASLSIAWSSDLRLEDRAGSRRSGRVDTCFHE